jgi:hypothetical protein
MSVVEQEKLNSPALADFEGQDFVYRPIPVLVPISLAFIFLSLVAAMLVELLVVPAMGAVLAFLAVRQIRASRGNLSGGRLALASAVIQLTMLAGFGTLHAYSIATEVPPGFERVSFTADISKKGFSNQNGMTGIHPDVQKLVDKKVMIKGYMYPTKTSEGLKSFVLCRDNGDCCFGGQPKTTDMILVHMTGENTARFRTGLVSVAGTFKAEPTVDETGLRPVYQLECEFFGPAKTWY